MTADQETEQEHPVRTRRRGAALEEEIYAATIEECAAVGYGRLSLKGVAARARTGKAALYRRWSTPQELLLDAFAHLLPVTDELPETGSLRGNLLAALHRMNDSLAGRIGPPAMVLMGDLLRHPELVAAFRARLVEPRLEAILAVMRRAAENGEISPAAVTDLAARTGPAHIIMHFLMNGTPPDDRTIESVVDEVVLPVLQPSTAAEETRHAPKRARHGRPT